MRSEQSTNRRRIEQHSCPLWYSDVPCRTWYTKDLYRRNPIWSSLILLVKMGGWGGGGRSCKEFKEQWIPERLLIWCLIILLAKRIWNTPQTRCLARGGGQRSLLIREVVPLCFCTFCDQITASQRRQQFHPTCSSSVRKMRCFPLWECSCAVLWSGRRAPLSASYLTKACSR
jgi:hypothetical protein